MPRLEFDAIKSGTNVRKHGISLERFDDMDLDAPLVAEDAIHSTPTETRWTYVGPIRWPAAIGIVAYRGDTTRAAACAAPAAVNGSSMSKHSDDPENPEPDAGFFAGAQRGLDGVPRPIRASLLNEQTRRGRGPQRTPTKKLVSLRLDPDVVIAYRKTGRGWQGRINAVLRKTIRAAPTPHVSASVVADVASTSRNVIRRKPAKKR